MRSEIRYLAAYKSYTKRDMMPKRVFIIHGWEASPDSNWFPWLKTELENRGIEVVVPQMPNTMHPNSSDWLAYLQKIVGTCDENTYFVGHSLGVIAILQYLETLSKDQKAGGAVLVAGFVEDIDFDELKSFVEKPLNFKKIKGSVNQIVAIHSDNDPYVPLKHGEILRDQVDAELIVIPNAGHLVRGSGYFEFPEVLESVLK